MRLRRPGPRFSGAAGRPSVGLAYSTTVHAFVERHPALVDHVEIPYELLRHDPRVVAIRERIPVILHCASLSIAGTVPCPAGVAADIAAWVRRTASPWIGEHLAFVTASRGPAAEPVAPGEPYNIGYTVSPPMNPATAERAAQALLGHARRFPVPIIVENSPVYFAMPGSTMAQAAFIRAVCEQADAGLLLNYARVALASLAAGVARGAYEYARDYAKQREAFGRPIAQFQAVAFMLAEMAIEVEASRAMAWEAAWTLDQGKDATQAATLAKHYADEAALFVTDRAVQVLGGHGYIREHPVERWLRDARGFAATLGLAMI